jgi:hypothetical protein
VLDRNLGLDSLSRVELFTRVQAEFQVNLPDRTFTEIETPRDLVRAIVRAASARSAIDTTTLSGLDLDAVGALPSHAETLLDVLQWHVACHADRPHVQFYSDENQQDVMTYGELWEGANEVAAELQQRELEPGQAVIIMLPTGPD